MKKALYVIACLITAAGMFTVEHYRHAPAWRLIVLPGVWLLIAADQFLPQRARKKTPADSAPKDVPLGRN